MTAITSETKPKKNQENSGRKKWLKLRWIGPIGAVLALLGLFLTPFVIGLPIMTLGWLMLTFGFFYSKYLNWVPKKYRQAMTDDLKREYAPYKPAAQSLLSILGDIFKISALFFLAGIIVILFLYFRS